MANSRGSSVVDVGALTGTLIEAVQVAGGVIREVHAGRGQTGALSHGVKDANDPNSFVTAADTQAQAAVVGIIAEQWPGLRVVGEEEEGDGVAHEGGRPGRRVDCGHDDEGCRAHHHHHPWVPAHLRAVPLHDICVFVDPLDGTREFVGGGLAAVQVLAGVSVRGTPVAGVVGLPFFRRVASERRWSTSSPSDDDAAADGIIYGIVGSGVFGLPKAASRNETTVDGVCLTTSRSPAGMILDGVRAAIAPDRVLELPGCGNKALAVLTGEADAAIWNFGSSLWDSCAYAALLEETGGSLTDLFGCPIPHTPDAPFGNTRGVFLSGARLQSAHRQGRSHRQLCRQFMHSGLLDELVLRSGLLPDGEPQAMDIARDIAGRQLTTAELGEAVGCPGLVTGYTVPEATAVRYKQSDAARINLQYHPTAARRGPASVFMKRIVPRDMPYAHYKAKHAPSKLTRDVRSCRVEASFLQSPALKRMCEGAQAPHFAPPYQVRMKPSPADFPLDSAYMLLLKDFSPAEGWEMAAHFDAPKMHGALKALAYMHAFFWRGTRTGPGAQDMAAIGDVWPNGCYWHLGQLPEQHLDQLVPNWERQRQEFAPLLTNADVGDDCLSCLGVTLLRRAHQVHRELHYDAHVDSAQTHCHDNSNKPFFTLIHGDPKPGNFFFLSQANRSESSDALPRVGLIDFQWTGWGVAAVDVAYCIAASSSAQLLSSDGASEDAMLSLYHECLVDSLLKLNVYDCETDALRAAPRQVLSQQYKAAFIDLARVVIAEHWANLSLGQLKQREGHMSFNAYNKSAAHVAWFITRVAAILLEE